MKKLLLQSDINVNESMFNQQKKKPYCNTKQTTTRGL